MVSFALEDDASAADVAELSTAGGDSSSTASADLASEALRSAREIASGRGGAANRMTGRLKRRRSRLSNDERNWSGARPDARDPMSIGAVLGKSIAELGWSAPLSEARLLGQWSEVVGAEIAAHSRPVGLREGELRIDAESTAWATQLRIMAPQLLARIRQEMPSGTVQRLLIAGPSTPSWKRGPWSMRGGRGVRDTYG
jgi:predicted nucleic acid-binding Zn ribbon protein